jgi:hypothetical protein
MPGFYAQWKKNQSGLGSGTDRSEVRSDQDTTEGSSRPFSALSRLRFRLCGELRRSGRIYTLNATNDWASTNAAPEMRVR